MIRMPWRAGQLDHGRAGVAAPSGPASANPVLTTTAPRTRFCGALGDDARHRVGRHGDDGEVDVVGDVEHRGVGRDAGHVGGGRVDRVHRPFEAAVQEVAEHLPADRAQPVGGADHRHRPRPQEAGDGAALGPLLAPVDRLECRPGVGSMSKATSMTPPENSLWTSKPARRNTPSMGRLSGSTSAVNRREAVAAGDGGEVLEQERGDAAAVVGVVDGEGHLGLVPPGPAVVAGHRDQVVAEDRPPARRGRPCRPS